MSVPPAATASPASHRIQSSQIISKDENVKVNGKVGKEDTSNANVSDVLTSLLRFESDGFPPQKKSGSGRALSASSLVNQSSPKKMKLSHVSPDPPGSHESNPMDQLLEKLSQRQAALQMQGDSVNVADDATHSATAEHGSSSNSVPMTPAVEIFGENAPTMRPASAVLDDGESNTKEILRLKLELAQAQNKISHLDSELSQTRQARPGLEHSASYSPVDTGMSSGIQTAPNPPRISGPPYHNPSSQQVAAREGGWPAFDDSRSDTSDALSATGFNRSRDIWGPNKSGQGSLVQSGFSGSEVAQSSHWGGRGVTPGYMDPGLAFEPSAPGGYRGGGHLTPDFDLAASRSTGSRRNNRFDNRFVMPQLASQSAYASGFNYGTSPYEPVPTPASGSGMYSNYQPTPIGTSLSPLASEFTSATGSASYKSEPVSEGQTFLPTTEPLNYRRLLDRTVTCNWKYIVDKIVCNNDQQASIFLQQKLKVGTPEQKYGIVEAIVAQAYNLMVNRFGNFLVQRCFEHGTPEQVIKIAEAIRGSTLQLSMDPFGCHVVQKAFDSVPEDYKAIMVHELLRRIPDTVIHRYACHVWQKLFELRWSESPPQIMKYVNDALRGMWHEVALGETGSLVVQNIFENCLEEDKRPCIEEVLANIDIVAHGQFGNWCIQHICEHGAPADRSRAIDHVIRYAAEYSMDQYASKVVEKCLKIGGGEFLTRYLDRVCEGRPGRPRIPLIDIASDQYGNYLIQWILTHASPQHREIVAAHIRKHMVSLRGSKFGSRVGMLCTNPAVTTRPGPGVGSGLGRTPAGPRYNSRAYQ
ncbi:ARM repeat-containing protein [Durotheca rogersii]|uniref:ARM repeat-containing protein n=1 Tax=Durotheca rogersii TaxID=419775 RepID=UPI00221EB8EE|nr:ARM repeat-containing protein [Durotheca rogersii]KAI5864182.1 ARM repeat-containing protein [Durotheca rogersii]